MRALCQSLLLLASLVLSVAPAAAFPDWLEPMGGQGHGSSAPDLRAPLTAPVEVWGVEFDQLLGQPVVSAGVVYVVAKSGKGAKLFALDLQTGEEIDSESLAGEEFGHVSVLGSAVVAVTDEAHYYFEHRGKSFKRGKVVRGAFRSPASLLPGLSAVTTPEGLQVLELRNGKVLFEHPSDECKPLVVQTGEGEHSIYTVYTEALARNSGAQTSRVIVSGAGTSSPTVSDPQTRLGGAVVTGAGEQQARLVQLEPGPGWGPLLVASNSLVMTRGKDTRPFFFAGPGSSNQLPALESDPVRVGVDLYGRTGNGIVLRSGMDGGGEGLMEAKDRPEGGVDGPITSAGEVLLMGNWALDLPTRRILWVARDMEFTGPLIPVADGTVLYQSGAGRLVCAHDVNASEVEAEVAPPELPESLEVEDGYAYRIVVQARAALDRAFAEDLIGAFETYSKRRLLADARRVLAEAETRGLPHSEVAALESKLAGKSENSAGNRDRQLAAAQEDEAKVRTDAAERTIEFAKRCAEASLGLEAAALLATVEGYFPSGESVPEKIRMSVQTVAAASMPANFPFRSEGNPEARWVRWARELAPAGAWFVEPASILDAKRGAPIDGQPRPQAPPDSMWRQDTIGLRTKNLSLLSRTMDPAIVGACLRNGEATVRTLETLLANPPQPDDEPLQVRIHASRPDYLNEDLGEGEAAPEWSLGFYMPWTRVSRFFVPDSSTSLNQGRSLHEVVSHELTHQYIAERWREVAGGRRTANTPGYWIVEGFARFIEDQSLEIARRGDALDDPTVQSVESAAAIHSSGGGIPLELLLRLDQLQFQRLADDPLGTVQLKSTLVHLTHTAKSAFYDQAAAVVFFLANRSGPEGRERLLATIRSHYKGETGLTPWREMGFKTRASLEKALAAFLDNPGLAPR
ncbi:hypothetical protein Poly30_36670 [Planctomycetes bacterium Poly30]|uniref:Peptidase MA-like domain-containing protein n=1 Tax=Saltatorellus ferox TaxID=2528018 RepID=A0A518EVM3_9BACT|nr:hypothetical protein Poly30_36670 [Planctomycetes bacterium Poly30]